MSLKVPLLCLLGNGLVAELPHDQDEQPHAVDHHVEGEEHAVSDEGHHSPLPEQLVLLLHACLFIPDTLQDLPDVPDLFQHLAREKQSFSEFSLTDSLGTATPQTQCNIPQPCPIYIDLRNETRPNPTLEIPRNPKAMWMPRGSCNALPSSWKKQRCPFDKLQDKGAQWVSMVVCGLKMWQVWKILIFLVYSLLINILSNIFDIKSLPLPTHTNPQKTITEQKKNLNDAFFSS